MDQADSKNNPTIRAAPNDVRQSIMTMTPRKPHIHVQRDKVDMTGVAILMVVLIGALGGWMAWDSYREMKKPKLKKKKVKQAVRVRMRWVEPK